MEYTVKFVYHGKLKEVVEANAFIAKEIEKVYFALYNEFIKMVNPKYAEWNEEFNKMYPNHDGYSDEYNRFIKQKQLTVANVFNRKITNMVKGKFVCNIGIGSENNPILYIPMLGNFESGDYVEFYLI